MEDIQTEAKQTLQNFINRFSDFNQETINRVPFEGSWTAGQVAEHMILANANFAEVLNGLTEDTLRKPDEKVGVIKSILTNFDTKLDSPEFLCPLLKDYNQHAQLKKLNEIKDEILKASANIDLTKTCKNFELPLLGFLTRLEAISFVIYHTQRHTLQLGNIFHTLAVETN